jgi:type IV secretory pathway VirB2 component (pilin)
MADTGLPSGSGVAGVCQAIGGGSAENNAIGDILCNTYKIATGKVGRGLIVVVLFVTGISFYLGKVQWGTIVAIVIGAGLCFGGPAIVSVMVGKNFLC